MTNEPRVAVVAHSHPNLTKGGAEIAAYTLFKGLLEQGVDAIFVAAAPETARGRLSLASNREHIVFYDPARYDHTYHIAMPQVTSELIKILVDCRTTIVNFHHYLYFGSNTVQKVASSSVWHTFLTLHEYLAICQHHGQMVTRPAEMLCDAASLIRCNACFPEMRPQQIAARRDHLTACLAAVGGFISPSKFLADRYVGWGLPKERFAVIENGLPHSHQRRAVNDGRSVTFGFFGQINPYKGVDTLLAAAELISKRSSVSDRIRIVLHGNVVGQSESFVNTLERAVREHPFLAYRGPYDNTAVGQLMGECDYVLVPSSWWENSPVVIQEAYAVGRPVICSGIGGMAEKVIDGVTGFHFRLRDAADLVRVLEQAAEPGTAGRLAQQLPAPSGAADMARRYLGVFGVPSAAAKRPANIGPLSGRAGSTKVMTQTAAPSAVAEGR